MLRKKIVTNKKEVKGVFIRNNGKVIFKPDPKGKFTLIHIEH